MVEKKPMPLRWKGENMMKVIGIFLMVVSTGIMIGSYGCSNARIIDNAIKKHGAGIYYHNQRDYVKAKLNCNEALKLWEEIRKSNTMSYPDWAVAENMEQCRNVIEATPTPGALSAAAIVPLKILRNRIFVTARMNQTQNAVLLLDTGATSTILSPGLADKIGIAPDEDSDMSTVYLIGGKKVEMPFVKLSQISIGDATVSNLRVGVFSVDPDDPLIDGILGEDFLSHYNVSIDHQAKELTLTSR